MSEARCMNSARVRHKPGPSVRALRWAGCIIVFFLQWSAPAAGQELAATDPNRVKAAFIRNFARYVTWPDQSLSDNGSPWRIGVLGNDPFGEVLEKSLEGRTEQGRPFAIARAATLDKLPPCQIVFVGYEDAARRRVALAELQKRPVLTVSDAPGFLREGGIIRFQTSEHVEFSVNLDQARAVSLTVQTKMLEVAREVIDNGTVRSRP